jgi:uncharacterized membrane protein
VEHDALGASGEGPMASVAETGESMSVGHVFSRGFGVIVDNPVTVFGIAFLIGALPSVLISWLQQRTVSGQMDSEQIVGSLAVAFGSIFVSLLLQALVQGSLVRATLAYARGERATFAECVGAALAVVLPLLGLVVLMVIGIWIGMIFLFVPGVMLFVMWSVASPALVAERTGVFEALGRSRELTRGARWKVFGIEAILVVGYYIFILVLGAGLIAAVGTDFRAVPTAGLSLGWILASVLMSVIVNTVWSTIQSSLYVELRNWKEGLPEQALEDIFA